MTRGVARIALGLQDTIALGNLEARRDWGFAGDYVDAMWRMLQQDVADDYVIATGQTHSIRDLLEVAFAAIGVDDWSKHVEQDPRFFRPAEVDLLIGDCQQGSRRARLAAHDGLRRRWWSRWSRQICGPSDGRFARASERCIDGSGAGRPP